MKRIKKLQKIISTVILTLLITSFSFCAFADVGGVQRYKSDSSGSSSSSSSSSKSSRRSSSSSSSSSSRSGDISIGGIIFIIIMAAIIAGFKAYLKKKGISKDQLENTINQIKDETNLNSILGNTVGNNTLSVANQVREIDPLFSEEKFLAWSKEVFIKLQNAWTQRNWAAIRPFEANELFQQHAAQLQELTNANKINVVERINVQHASLYSFTQDGDKEYLRIKLKAVMRDYIIDENTKQVLEGNPNEDQYMSYMLTFMRKAGVKTQEGKSNKSTTNCPNCGAPTQVTSAGQCEYCGSIITTGEHDWVLSNLEGM